MLKSKKVKFKRITICKDEMTNMTKEKSNLMTIATNLAAQSPIVMMEKRIVTTSIAFQASLKNSPKPIFWKNAKG